MRELLIIWFGSPMAKFKVLFTEDEQEAMKNVNKYERYMRGSGQYYDVDDVDEMQEQRELKKSIEPYLEILNQKCLDFMQYNHWRTWNP